jgi:DNA invertase Pin-like site-specific DNA recombinase
MSFVDVQQKVTAAHLTRNAYLYIRQSTLRQVFENTESTKRQYALREKAVALGWQADCIIVIDSDLGQSGAQAVDREGFQRLVTEVGLGHAGVVMGLEVSRLARNSSDWYRLLEICALADTLILDEDGIYNPAHFNDRLLLGLKGTMSEAESHVLRSRLLGGQFSKAKRGELKFDLPVGFVFDDKNKVKLDPDQQVQKAIKLFFETFNRTGSAYATCRELNKQNILFPRKIRKGPHRNDIVWGSILHSRALQLLHNPCYAGVYSYGKRKRRKLPNGDYAYKTVPQNEWMAFIPDAHPGYISLEQHQDNLRRLEASRQTYGHDRRKSSPREGPALLQGLVVCGVCGDRMTVRYKAQNKARIQTYICQRRKIENCQSKACQSITGDHVDECISQLLLETVSPMALEVALSVQEELQNRMNEVVELRQKQVERIRYEAELARRRYMRVDPDNRLVASSLEFEWNQKLRELTDAQEHNERQCKEDQVLLNQQQRDEILALTSDFSKLWKDTKTPDRERKRIVRLLIEDVTLTKNGGTQVDVRFKGGTTRSFSVTPKLNGGQMIKIDQEVVQLVDKLLEEDHTYTQIATILNRKGFRSVDGMRFTKAIVERIPRRYNVPTRYERLRSQGFLTSKELSDMLGGASQKRIYELRDQGYIEALPTTCRKQMLFKPPTKKTIKLILRMPPKKIGRPPKRNSLNTR